MFGISLRRTRTSLCAGSRRWFASDASTVRKEGDPTKIALEMTNVTKSFQTGRKLFTDISMSFYDGAKVGLLGVNGSGKSSLMKILAGEDKEFDGDIRHAKNYRVGYLAQEPVLDDTKTVHENVMAGVQHKVDLLHEFEHISAQFAEEDADFDQLIELQSRVQHEIEKHNCWELQHNIDIALNMLNCPPSNSSVVNLSGGERRRVALCRLLLSEPDILFLDEPTNHLDAASVSWLEDYLDTYKGLVVAITHDRYFLDKITGYILEIDRSQIIPFKGNYGNWLESKSLRLLENDRRDMAQKKSIEKELEWLRGKGAKRKENKARKGRLDEQLEQQAQQKLNQVEEGGSLLIPNGPALRSDEAILVDKLTIQIDDRTLIRDLSFSIGPGTRLGIIGANGTGKSTLLKAIAGKLKPTKGSVTLSDQVVLAYNEQSRDALDPSAPVWEEICAGREYIQMSPDHRMLARTYCAQFNFRGAVQQKRIGSLSGGERNRVQLAKTLSYGCNVILLDEPTNDLDVDTLRGLEDAISMFKGAAVIVSHDRWFLDRTCNQILSFEPNGETILFNGNYTLFKLWKQRTRKK